MVTKGREVWLCLSLLLGRTKPEVPDNCGGPAGNQAAKEPHDSEEVYDDRQPNLVVEPYHNPRETLRVKRLQR